MVLIEFRDAGTDRRGVDVDVRVAGVPCDIQIDRAMDLAAPRARWRGETLDPEGDTGAHGVSNVTDKTGRRTLLDK